MSKATKVLPILTENLDYFELIELVELISDYILEMSQEGTNKLMGEEI